MAYSKHSAYRTFSFSSFSKAVFNFLEAFENGKNSNRNLRHYFELIERNQLPNNRKELLYVLSHLLDTIDDPKIKPLYTKDDLLPLKELAKKVFIKLEEDFSILSLATLQIFIRDKDISTFDGHSITGTCIGFMEALGFFHWNTGLPYYGSFYQRVLMMYKRTFEQEKIEDVYEIGKKAVQLKVYDLPTADQTDKLASAAEKMVNSLKKVDEGVVRLGAILVIKSNYSGRRSIIVEQLSPKMITILEQKPELIHDIKTLYEAITGKIELSNNNFENGEF